MGDPPPPARVDTAAARCDRSAGTLSGTRFNARWIVLHMIQDTARHNGHADLLREAIDGITGD